MPIINTFVWITPALKVAVADHTWVTSYDNREIEHPNIAAVKNAQELYWYCKGNFHSVGKSSRTRMGLVLTCKLDKTGAECLVVANYKENTGTIKRYGIDGVCPG
jgi:hypothetical protein